MSSSAEDRADGTRPEPAPTRFRRKAEARQEQGLARELRASALLLGLSFGTTAVVVVSAQAAAALLGS